MQQFTRLGAIVCALLAVGTASAAAQGATDLPEGVTKEMVADGQKIFKGQGLCQACHGPEGKGVPGLGANLTDTEWLHSDGSHQAIIESILKGVSADKSSTGSVMPPKGGSGLSEKQVRAVAAYVWSVSRPAK
ncbi:MAG: c-type cytochrome [Gemmatimonadota bacterium]|nr:c-type cytochrome [Gemmatimonadota bacterium]MDH3366865.1 c-type cytochrome [Gemmatimonadota bacterium]MDH3477601.1 c-type cytochrome [Gemmatimonadota bacterium]MDH3568744.1 c-type cytochrome [Gemmatimonadota bacterium]MDH5549451.1 c-type cytochrome [Gemmatimonadota bacterium]